MKHAKRIINRDEVHIITMTETEARQMMSFFLGFMSKNLKWEDWDSIVREFYNLLGKRNSKVS